MNFKLQSIVLRSKHFNIFITILSAIAYSQAVLAQKTYTPTEVYSAVEYSAILADTLLANKNIEANNTSISMETDAKPMHVYELHTSALVELYKYSLDNNRRPPPIVVSTPTKYSPTDVYYLSQIIRSTLISIVEDAGLDTPEIGSKPSPKTPSDVYKMLYQLFYKLHLLNGKNKISPSEVFAHVDRAKEDLQNSLFTLANKLDNTEQTKKRRLVTAIYGMHPDGTTITPLEENRSPENVISQAFLIRDKLNKLRLHYNMSEIRRPELSDYSKPIKPIDVFLQTQFIIAELNILKKPMKINSTTHRAKPTFGKTPSDVYQEMKHINYMLTRIINAVQ